MKTNGFISLHRQLLTWQWHNNPTMMTVWTHLLLLAEYEEREQDGIVLHRGEVLVSQLWLAEYIGISISQVRSCLTALEKTHEITKKRTHSLTLIKILHYDEYQHVTSSSIKQHSAPNHEQKHALNHDKEINNNKYNKKNLSDGEIKTTPASQLRTFATALWKNTAWLNLCCKTYSLPLDHVQRYAIAFYEQMRTEQPNKTWLSDDDFCRHFLSWLKFQTPQKVARYLHSFRMQKQKLLWRKAEEVRQAEMWREIEESKRKAISYEEYKTLQAKEIQPQSE